ncbi:MAG: hypothetical protein ACOZNI_27070 [Myxococcota bacterium]
MTTPPSKRGEEAGECADAADNDRNAQYNCADEDCMASPDCEEPENTPLGAPEDAIHAAKPRTEDTLVCADDPDQITVHENGSGSSATATTPEPRATDFSGIFDDGNECMVHDDGRAHDGGGWDCDLDTDYDDDASYLGTCTSTTSSAPASMLGFHEDFSGTSTQEGALCCRPGGD